MKLESDPTTDVEKLIAFGQMALEQGWYDKAREYFEQALELDTTNQAAIDGLARVDEILRRKASFEPAKPEVPVAKPAQPDKAEIEKLRDSARAGFKAGYYRTSRGYYEQVLALDPSNQEAIDGLARIDKILKCRAPFEPAKPEVPVEKPAKETISAPSTPKKPTKAEIEKLRDSARAGFKAGYYRTSRGYYEQVLALDPSNQEAIDGLARIERILLRKGPVGAPAWLKEEEEERQRKEKEKRRREEERRKRVEEEERQRREQREKSRRTRERTKTETRSKPGDKSPYDVLNIKPNATEEEIITAYRRMAQMYHPDKVAGLAPEFKELAEERMKAINAAYEQLRRSF